MASMRKQVALSELMEQATKLPLTAVESAVAAMRQRLVAAAGVLLTDEERAHIEGANVAVLLAAVVEVVKRHLRHDEAWLVLTAVTTVFPMDDVVLAFVRKAELHSVEETTSWLLERTLRSVRASGAIDREMELLVGGVVVDVDFAAKYEHNSGIQRVVRRAVPIWAQHHELTLVAWGDGQTSWRTITSGERDRVLKWDQPRDAKTDTEQSPKMVVPWRSTVLLVEVPNKVSHCLPLASMARLSGNTISAIGYDVIPITSAETVPIDMSDHFAKYLTIVKYMKRIAAISGTAAKEFAGFANMLPAQGIAGPDVVSCQLPSDETHVVSSTRSSKLPLVVCVGSKEPRKNHVAVLAAAEQLWREGLDFELFFIGIVGWDARYFKEWEKRLSHRGYPVRAPARVGDGDLWRAYADARFTIFPSLHEGYGLPVAESLAYGTPVIATNYGSTAEIAADGGCLLVDPRDDESVTNAMRRLLTDDDLLAALRTEALNRPRRTWQEYADDLWDELVTRE